MKKNQLEEALNKFLSQSAVAFFAHGQLIIFWALAFLAGYGLRRMGIEDRRLLLAGYPLFQALVVTLLVGPASVKQHLTVLVLLLYGVHLLVLFNPQELGWFRHILLLQMYFSSVAVFTNILYAENMLPNKKGR